MMRLFPLERRPLYYVDADGLLVMRPFSLGRRTREPDPADDDARCGMGTHVLVTAGMRLQTPTPLDVYIALAAKSDPQAQHWLGSKPGEVVPKRQRQRLLGIKPGQGPSVHLGAAGGGLLVAVDPGAGKLIGCVECNVQTGEMGGWLAPEFRGRGLGAVLFARGAELGHHHLGLTTVKAGAEPANKASIRALTAAGFTPMPGPETYTLPNGREIPAAWFRHDCDRPARCAW